MTLNFLLAFGISFSFFINLQTLFFEHVIPCSLSSFAIRGLPYLCLYSKNISFITLVSLIFSSSLLLMGLFCPFIISASMNIKDCGHPHYWKFFAKVFHQGIFFLVGNCRWPRLFLYVTFLFCYY